jgi:predicted HAD superfamily Cof-like phosphohydrolase
MNIHHDVRQFHLKFGHPAPVSVIRDLTTKQDMLDFRIKLIREECDELVEALEERDLAKIAAESVDLIYVVVGTLVALGLPLLPFWRDVQRANMQKEKNPNGGKPIKPEGWEGPNPQRILRNL